jgi:hypothetical protein
MTQFSWAKHLLILGLIAVPLGIGAYYGFPVFDDWYYSALVKEQGPVAMIPAHGDRPLFGIILQLVAAACGSSVVPLVAFNLCLWTAFALEAAWLWRLIYPAYRQYSLLICCLVLAPVVVRIQVSTVTVLIPCLVPTVLSYTALLLILCHYENQTWRTAALCWFGCALAALGALFSEYALASAAASAVVAAGYRSPATAKLSRLRRSIPIISLLVCVIAAYGVFLRISDPTARPNIRPNAWLGGTGLLPNKAFHFTSSVVQVLIGSYADQLARIQPRWDSKSTIAPLLYGFLVCLVLWRSTANSQMGTPVGDKASRLPGFILPAAVLAGLAPVAAMGRDTTQLIFTSRLLLPVLPVGVMASVFLSLRIVKPRYCPLVVALFGFLAGAATLDAVVGIVKGQRLAGSIGTALLPYMRDTTGLVVAVVDPQTNGTTLGDLTSRWPTEQSRRFWIFPPLEAKRLFGSPTACLEHPTIEFNYRTIRRSGPVEELLFVDASVPSEIHVERYCHHQLSSPAADLRARSK